MSFLETEPTIKIDLTTTTCDNLVVETLKSLRGSKSLKKRIIAIYIASQRSATVQDIGTLMDAAGLGPNEQRFIQNLDILVKKSAKTTVEAGKGGLFSTIFGSRRPSVKIPPTAEGEYSDTRHVGLLKGLVEQMINGELPVDKYPSMGPSISSSSEAKGNAKSMRRYGANNRWGKRETNITGSRVMCFGPPT